VRVKHTVRLLPGAGLLVAAGGARLQERADAERPEAGHWTAGPAHGGRVPELVPGVHPKPRDGLAVVAPGQHLRVGEVVLAKHPDGAERRGVAHIDEVVPAVRHPVPDELCHCLLLPVRPRDRISRRLLSHS
jgi:hypothetical protein